MDVGGEEKDAIDHLFEIEFETTMTNIANPDEEQDVKKETAKKLGLKGIKTRIQLKVM